MVGRDTIFRTGRTIAADRGAGKRERGRSVFCPVILGGSGKVSDAAADRFSKGKTDSDPSARAGKTAGRRPARNRFYHSVGSYLIGRLRSFYFDRVRV